jgi:DNA-binding transcriptional LysR family regulator
MGDEDARAVPVAAVGAAAAQTPASFSHSQLAYFVQVAETGQISKAARILYMAQPALSQAIARLERQLGLELLERHPAGVRLTEAGEAFLSSAKRAVHAHADAAATAGSLARCRSGSLGVGFLSAPPPLIVPAVMDAFCANWPEVSISFRELPFPIAPATDWLADVDVALCHAPVAGAGVAIERLWSEPRAVLMHMNHPLSRRRRLRAEHVLHERFCGYTPTVDPQWAAYWTLEDIRGGPAEELTSDTPANALELVAALATGSGISVLPANVARMISAVAPPLRVRVLEDAPPCFCSLVWRDPPENSFALAFVETARQSLSREVA